MEVWRDPLKSCIDFQVGMSGYLFVCLANSLEDLRGNISFLGLVQIQLSLLIHYVGENTDEFVRVNSKCAKTAKLVKKNFRNLISSNIIDAFNQEGRGYSEAFLVSSKKHDIYQSSHV